MIRNALKVVSALLFVAPAARAQDIAIEGGTVHTRPGETMEDATVVIRDGTIVAAGAEVAVPQGARRIDASGKEVTAGFVDPYSRVGMVEVNAVSSTNEGQFSSDLDEEIHAGYRVTDGYNPRSVTISVARTGGVTSAVAVPQGGLVSGAAAWMTLEDSAELPEVTARAPAAMVAVLGKGAVDVGSGTRGLAALHLRELLEDAETFPGRRSAYERGQSRELAAERMALEAMQPVLAGEIPLAVTAHRASDIRVALGIAEEFDIDLAIVGGTEAWLLAEELAEAEVFVILDPLANLPASFDRIHVRDDLAAELTRAGVSVAISSAGRASSVRRQRQRAGNAVARGMPWEDALAALTTVPATLYGLEGNRGEIAPGHRADVVIWSGDPFELSSHVEATFIEGSEQSLPTRQTGLRDRYLELDTQP